MLNINNFLTGQVQFSVESLPFSFLNKLRKYNISDIQIENTRICFKTNLKHAAQIKKLINNFEYEMSENKNLFRGINFLLNHFVLVVAIVAAIICYFFADLRIYQIKVQCDDIELTPAIYQHLDQIGFKKFMWKKQLQQFDLATDLIQNFNQVAHANVKICGNTLLVNLVTAFNELEKFKTNYYAQYDAVITEVTTYSGTALVTVGDVVKKGDLLIANAYPDSAVVIGEVAFVNGDQISRLNIWII